MVVYSLAQGVLLGLGAAVPIGPVNVELARRTLRGGFRSGVALGIGAVTVDVIYAALTALSLRPSLIPAAIQAVLGISGILLLLYLATLCFISAAGAIRASGSPLDDACSPSLRGGYVTGLLMTLLNPMTLAFWFLIVPATVGRLGDGNHAHLLLVCMGVFAGTITWVLSFAGVLSVVGRFRRNWWIVGADAVGGLILTGFALAAVWALLKVH